MGRWDSLSTVKTCRIHNRRNGSCSRLNKPLNHPRKVLSAVADVAKKMAAENANARSADRQMATIVSATCCRTLNKS